MLRAHLSMSRGEFSLAVDVEVGDGEVVGMLGPNGAGKSTLIRALAGLSAIDEGRIVLAETVLDDPSDRVFVSAEDRSIGVVFQDYLLFPRMSVLDNVAFGLRSRGVDRSAARTQAGEWLERFGLGPMAGDRPGALSGGQAQRVALARALITEPQLLLLDEPLAALDASTRLSVRAELRSHLASFDGARLLVTHDPMDALVLADRLVIIESGRVVQTGTPAEVTAHPASRYVADLVGVNLLEGQAVGERTVRLAGGAELTVADALPAEDVAVAVRPQAVTLSLHRPDGSARNLWSATVGDIESNGDRVRITLSDPVPLTAEITAGSANELGLAPGSQVWASVKAVDVVAYTV